MSYPVNFSVNVSGATITNNLKVQACDPTTLAVEQSITITGPHTFPLDISFSVDEAKQYIIRLIEVTGGGDVVRNEYSYNAAESVFSTEPDMELVVDRSVDDPVSGETEFEIPELEGIEFRLVQRGVGPLEPGVEFDYLEAGGFKLLGDGIVFIADDTFFIQKYPPSSTTPKDMFLRVGRGQAQDPITGETEYRNTVLIGKSYRVEQRAVGPKRTDEITIVSAGGFDLLGGVVFIEDDTYVIHFYPTIVINSAGNTTSGGFPTGVVEITANTSYDPAHLEKIIRFKFTGSTGEYILPLIGAFPASKMLCFEMSGGNAKFATIKVAGLDDIEFQFQSNNCLEDSIWIGQNERIWLKHNGSRWFIANADWAFNQIGETGTAYKIPTNCCWMGAIGLQNRSDWPRLWWFIENFASDLIVSEAEWPTKKGKFSNGNGSTTFRVPDWTNQMSKAVDNSTRLPGSAEEDQVGQFTMDPITAKAGSHGGASDAESGTVALLNNSGTSEVTFTIKGTGSSVQQSGKENLVNNFGELKFIRA